MEIEHQQQDSINGKLKDGVAAAVDIRQFQNNVVGEGYQARHVVRQPSARSSKPMKVQDMTGGAQFFPDDRATELIDTGTRSYLENEGLRSFRKEIEKILAT